VKFACPPPWLLCALFYANDVFARAGGGHSFSGGGHGGGSSFHYSGGGGYVGGGGSGGRGDPLGDLILLLFSLPFNRPLVGIPLDAAIIYVIVMIVRARGPDHTIHAEPAPRAMAFRRADLYQAVEGDEQFSFAYFADFTYSLFAEVHKARGAGKLANYSSYLSDVAIQKLQGLSAHMQECRAIVVGGWHVQSATRRMDGLVEVRIEFAANYSEVIAGREVRWYSDELWALTRQAGVQSKRPEELTVLGCPSCGAALGYSSYRVCSSCGCKVEGGEFNWFVRDLSVRREANPPLLTSANTEDSTDLPTQYARDYESAMASYQLSHPEFILQDFLARATEIFMHVQKGWSERRWELTRAYETDRLFQSHLYWIEEYKRQGLRNALSEVKIHRMEPVSLAADAFVVSLTVRIYASMVDVTVNEQGEVLSGDARRPHTFSEYWTFIRGQSAPAKALTPFGQCPSCGATMKIGMAGTCEYCGNNVTTGNYDWVLSLIEQAEAYEA
jgi:hypothetical protein